MPDSVREQIRHSFDFANGVLSICKRVAPRLLNDYANHLTWSLGSAQD